MIPLRVNDLKQYAYCPRIVFYQYVMPVSKVPTYKMQHGQQAEAHLDQMEKRRKLTRYGLEQGKRHFHVWLSSERLGLSGKLDLLIETEKGFYPVDFKFTAGRKYDNHRYQLCGYALLVEDKFGGSVSGGFLYLIPEDEVVEVPITNELRDKTSTALEDARRFIRQQQMPPPTPYEERCTDCEYRNYCADIF